MALAQFVEEFIARLREAPVDLARLHPGAIPGSLFSGAAGVAFFLHETARLRGEEELLTAARRWYAAARAWADHATSADWKEFQRGFLHGETGLAYVEALLAARGGDPKVVLRAVERIERASARFDDIQRGFQPMEFAAGAAGVLCAARVLDARLPGGPEYESARSVLRRVRDRTSAMLLAAYADPLHQGPARLLGMAHGVAGEIWALLATPGADNEMVRARLSELAALRETDEEGFIYWLPGPQWESYQLGTWCNGMAGHTLLWCEVARQTGSAEASRIAELAAHSTTLFTVRQPSLCCGLAGHAVALQRYADLSGDRRFARWAYQRLCRAAQLAQENQAHVLGLGQGSLGVALVALSRLHGEHGFPCLEGPRDCAA